MALAESEPLRGHRHWRAQFGLKPKWVSAEGQRDNEGQHRIPGMAVALGCPNGNRNAWCLSCLELLSCRAQQQFLLWFLLAELCGYARPCSAARGGDFKAKINSRGVWLGL